MFNFKLKLSKLKLFEFGPKYKAITSKIKDKLIGNYELNYNFLRKKKCFK